MRLLIKQKVFSWADSFEVFDENEQIRYYVKAELLSLGHQIHVYDHLQNEVAMIKEKVFSICPIFDIEINGEVRGRIQKKFTLFTPKYEVDFNGWRVEGDPLNWDFYVYSACSPVVYISKKILAWGDTYSIDILNPADELTGILLVLAIDAVNSSKK